MYYFLIFIIILLLLSCYQIMTYQRMTYQRMTYQKENYINYQDISFQGVDHNCPQIHADNYTELTNSYQMIQPFGYTKNELFDMTRFLKTDVPLPTDPDFFKHI